MEEDEGSIHPNDPSEAGESSPTDTDVMEHHLSFNALKGSHGEGTMRFHGDIQGVEIQILLDSGSSDNFLQPRC